MAKKKFPRSRFRTPRPPVPATAARALDAFGAERREPTDEPTDGGAASGASHSLEASQGASKGARRGGGETRNEDAYQAKAEPADAADDSSIPPVDIDADRFFAEGERAASLPHLWRPERGPESGYESEDGEHDMEPSSEIARRASPEVLARRARFRRVTQRVVAAFAVLAAVGLGKAALSRGASAELPLASFAHAAEPEARVADPVRAAAQVAPVVPPVVGEPVRPESRIPQPESADSVSPVAPVQPPASVAADAKEDRRLAQRAIDRGDNKGAVEAGERALDTDPSDATTWLIVGAAYQAMGQGQKARAAFSACVQKATHGPRGECAALR